MITTNENLEILDDRSRRSGFWSFNVGHVLILLTWLVSAVIIYEQIVNKIGNLESAVAILQTDDAQAKSSQNSLAVVVATQGRDLTDLHKSFDDDISGRLSKVEDRLYNRER